MTNRTLVWFRRDLRLHDHPALAAAGEAGEVAAVFVVSPEMKKLSASCWWLFHSLQDVKHRLEERGISFVMTDEPAETILPRLMKDHSVDRLVWNDSYSTAERAEELRVKKALEETCLSFDTYSGDLLFPHHELTKDNGEAYRVFTPFYKRSCNETVMRPVQMPEDYQGFKLNDLKQLDDLQLLPDHMWPTKFEAHWTPGEEAGIALFQSFARDDITDYKQMRDFPNANGTSRVSPYLTWGNVSIRAVYYAAKRERHAEPYLRQLVWREFAKRQLMNHPDLERVPLREEFVKFPWRNSREDFEKWTRGETGYPLVDAGMKELWETGWMHNRVRMVAASFLTKHLLLPWQWGAEWFRNTLVDYDEANNGMGWQWVAGTGIDAAPYFRIFNPTTQLEKFDKNEEYVTHWLKDHSDSVSPIVDHSEARARALEAYKAIK